MAKLKLISWNVNGIRAQQKKGFVEWLTKTSPDILCVQETKAHIEQLNNELINPDGYKSFWSSGEKKGYSGVATFTKKEPKKIESGLGVKKCDSEGRILITDYDDFILFNIYFPNGQRDQERLNYKMGFYDEFLKYIDDLKEKGKKIIVCGDVNTAHKEIDLARPKENINTSGFLPIERKWMDKLVEHGYIDTFREFNKDSGHYTYWDQITRARERNVGWRIDYFFISPNLRKNLKSAFIMSDVMGSDHCPLGIEIEL
ncbi:MAG: exodeoxyribonuclease III [Candidatus Melainabacteria bacterium RIFCSPHIGHO2_02_FULL_34_12]|nr:MAG: exodeoxyribonuclease III [Candidatus Melainabacteria bacterium RIFCSPHIGHO2_02_FULL_34_12]